MQPATMPSMASNAFEGVVIAMVVAFIATIALATLLTRSIVQPLAEAVGVAEVIAGGDLTRSKLSAMTNRHAS